MSDEPECMEVGQQKSSEAAGSVGAKERFELKKWQPAAIWKWDLDVDICAICRNNIMEPCIECQFELDKIDPNDCKPAWGTCNHGFHLHCITRWLRTRQVCPMDNSEWEYQRIGD